VSLPEPTSPTPGLDHSEVGLAAHVHEVPRRSGHALPPGWWGGSALGGGYDGLSSTLLSLMTVVRPLVAGNLITGIGGERGHLGAFSVAAVGFAAAWPSRTTEDRRERRCALIRSRGCGRVTTDGEPAALPVERYTGAALPVRGHGRQAD